MGHVFGHPQQPDGTLITTSQVMHYDGRVAITRSGTRYELEGDGVDAGAYAQ